MNKRVLVIDDEEAIRKSFVLALEDTGYQVDTAESGESALEMAKSEKYDLFYLDLKMPGMDGVQTLKELRKKDKDTPVYIITAFHSEFFESLRKVEKEGIDFELLKKPIGSEQIVTITRAVLEGPVAY